MSNQISELLQQMLQLLCSLNDQDKSESLAYIRNALGSVSPYKVHPIDIVRWIHIDRVTPNDYNPNSVASVEMNLLYVSISHDGYTQPIVAIYDDKTDKYVIVDGFHRYFTMKSNKDIYDTTGGFLPIVVIDKPINDRMASTVRHNRARGSHSVAGMGNLVFNMLDNGWSEEDICKEVGMDSEEIIRLKHVTGFSKLFADVEYKKAWASRRQIKIGKESGLEDFI